MHIPEKFWITYNVACYCIAVIIHAVEPSIRKLKLLINQDNMHSPKAWIVHWNKGTTLIRMLKLKLYQWCSESMDGFYSTTKLVYIYSSHVQAIARCTCILVPHEKYVYVEALPTHTHTHTHTYTHTGRSAMGCKSTIQHILCTGAIPFNLAPWYYWTWARMMFRL